MSIISTCLRYSFKLLKVEVNIHGAAVAVHSFNFKNGLFHLFK